MSEPPIDDATTPGLWLLAVPLLIALLVATAWLTTADRDHPLAHTPTAPEELHFTGCPQAGPVVLRRAEELGLEAPSLLERPGGFSLKAPLPVDEGDREVVLSVLLAYGAFAARPGLSPHRGPLADQGSVLAASHRLDARGQPVTVLHLDPTAREALATATRDDPAGVVSLWIDGDRVALRPNQPPWSGDSLELPTQGPGLDHRERLAAARAALLSTGTLPCGVDLEPTAP